MPSAAVRPLKSVSSEKVLLYVSLLPLTVNVILSIAPARSRRSELFTFTRISISLFDLSFAFTLLDAKNDRLGWSSTVSSVTFDAAGLIYALSVTLTANSERSNSLRPTSSLILHASTLVPSTI